MFLERPEWMARGRCVGTMEPISKPLMFPDDKNEKAIERAKAVCNTGPCRIRDECAEYALKNREPYGVWGGLSERDRRQILKQQRKLQRRLSA